LESSEERIQEEVPRTLESRKTRGKGEKEAMEEI
jgi:hypothetical protein